MKNTVEVKCPNCSGTGRVTVEMICPHCWGKGYIIAEKR